jgi:ABC-type multidrug transport system fused ATPase/permease subunit
MDNINLSKDIILLLQYLLPGFIAAWVFYSFTSYPKPSQFERVVEALIFTIIIQAVLFLLKVILIFAGHLYTFGVWNEVSQIVWSVCFAILMGLVLSYFSNNDKLHKFFRSIRITQQTSYASEWFHAFKENVTYVVLHFEDGRRIYGWPLEWPDKPNSGHFLITDASWLDAEGKEIPMAGVDKILVDAKQVRWVEFMKKTWEDNL